MQLLPETQIKVRQCLVFFSLALRKPSQLLYITSRCDVGTPGLHPCSNCLKANVKCIFSRASSPSPTTSVNRLSVSRAILPTVVAQDTIPALGYNQHDHRHKHHHFLQYPASDAYISPSVSLDEQYCDSYFFRHPNPVLSPGKEIKGAALQVGPFYRY